MLSLLSANSYDEMERIANGNREAMYIVEELKNMALEEEFGLAYNIEQEQRKRERTSRYYGYEEGKEIEKEEKRLEAAQNFIKNGATLELISKSLGYSIEELEKIKNIDGILFHLYFIFYITIAIILLEPLFTTFDKVVCNLNLILSGIRFILDWIPS